jgi:hypothetical protein
MMAPTIVSRPGPEPGWLFFIGESAAARYPGAVVHVGSRTAGTRCPPTGQSIGRLSPGRVSLQNLGIQWPAPWLSMIEELAEAMGVQPNELLWIIR